MDSMLIVAAGLAVLALVLTFVLIRTRSKAGTTQSAAQGTKGTSGSGTAQAETKLIPVTFYYASQTGNAERFSGILAKEAKREGFAGKAVSVEAFASEPDEAEEALAACTIAVFCVSTYGEGDPPDDARAFANWLKSDAGRGKLDKLHFAVFGLGNRQYQFFNQQGKQTDERLAALGASRAYALGVGDDDGTLESDFEQWKVGLWDGLRAAAAAAGLAPDDAASKEQAAARRRADSVLEAITPHWRVVTLPGGAGASPSAAAMAAFAAAADKQSKHLFSCVEAPVLTARELRQTAGVGASTLHVEIDLQATGLSYTTADNLYLCPDNDEATVTAVAGALGYDLQQAFALEPAGDDPAARPRPMFPSPCTLHTALTRYCDLHGRPRKELLQQLARYAAAEGERATLTRLASKAGEAEWADWVVKAERSVAEVFLAFPSLKGRVPLDVFFAITPRLQPRAYTIASSSKVHPSTVHICVSVLSTPKPPPTVLAQLPAASHRRLEGVCSNFLARLAAERSPRVRLYIRNSSFHLPADAGKPVVLVGPGTGIAPMRAFLQERRWQRQQGQRVGATILFFGCKRRDEDYIYSDELLQYCKDGTLTMLHTAFSREQGHKVYVQNHIVEQGHAVWEAVGKQEGHVYVCGATRMGSDVMAAFEKVIQEHGNMSKADASTLIKEMQSEGRYVQELWA